jgi:tetratricopeptide (TPR) repeat protein
MSAPEDRLMGSATGWKGREQLLEAFEAAWLRGERPRVEDYLSSETVDPTPLLIELVRLDLEFRLRSEEPARLEEYLERFPELAHDRKAVAELIQAEYGWRKRGLGAAVTWDEHVHRFPEYRQELAAIRSEDSPPPKSDQAGGETPPPRGLSSRETVSFVPAHGVAPSQGGETPVGTGTTAAWPKVPGYQILEELGRGGMGVVYKARQVGLERMVALKMILAGSFAGEHERARFRTEAEAVARLQHPNIVAIHEIGEREGLPYFSLEFCAGGSLARKLQGTPFPPRDAAQMLQTLVRAIHAAHDRQVIHRDLKPANILLMSDGTPKITDFGLAKKLDAGEDNTQTGAVMGTPSYMAPEQAEGRLHAVGPLSDVYALGAILYELLTGRPPFRGPTHLETLKQVASQEPVAPSRLQPKVPRDLDTICLKCLQKSAEQRYPTAEDLADDLRRFLNGEPIRARPTPAWERLRKWAWRKPAAAALVGVSLLAVAAVVAFSALYAVYESQQAGIYRQELKTIKEQEEVRERSAQTLLRAQRYEASKQWNGAHTELEKAREALDAQPELRADELRAEVVRRLVIVRQRLREQEQQEQARKRLQDFQAPYDDALFYATMFTGLSAVESGAKTREAARAALAVYGLEKDTVDGTPSPLHGDRPHHSAAEHAQLVGACYELLLTWAEVEASDPPDRAVAPEESRRRAEEGLALLGRAARLGRAHGLRTRSYDIRQASYLARSKGEKVQPAVFDPKAPGSPTGDLDWFLDGLERYHGGQFEQAARSCSEVLLLRSDHFWARYVLALCHLRMGRWVEGKAELTVCAGRRPDFVWPRLLRGFAASELGFRHTDARLKTAEFQAAGKDFNQVLKQSRDPLVRYVGLSNRGVLNIREQRWAEAVADLREAVKGRPAGFQGYLNLAQALQGMGQGREALQALDKAIKQAPNLAVLYESRARLHLLQRQRAAARADLERAIALEPAGSTSKRLVDNLVELGRLLHRERKYPAALACYDKALRLKPEFVLTQRFRAETLLALNQPKEAGQALDDYLAETKEATSDVYQARGLIFAGTHQLPAAIDMYTLALRQNPRDQVTRCYRGWAYLLTDAVRLALDDFQTCLREDSGNADALIGRGNARIRLRQRDEALADARSAARHGALTARQLYNLTRIYALALGHLEAEVQSAGPRSAWRAAQERLAQCQEEALDALRRAVETLPSAQRAGFWRDQVETDPALAHLRSGRQYQQMAARYAPVAP